MADEISVTVVVDLRNGFLNGHKEQTVRIDQTTPGKSANTQLIGNAYERVNFNSDVAIGGICYFINIDPAKTILIGLEVSSAFYELAIAKPGEPSVLRLATLDIFAKTVESGSARLEHFMAEE